MHITTKKEGQDTLIVHIELDAAGLQRFIDEAKSVISKAVTVEGFRKGKAPQHLAEKNISPEALRTEALERALEGSFDEAVKKEGWDIMTTADLKVERNDATGLKYSVRVGLWPAVTLPDLATISVPGKEVAVDDKETEEAFDTVRNMRATFLDKTEPAVVGDRVEVDFDASQNGTVIDGGSSRNHPLVIGGKSFMPGFEEELVGLAAGGTKQFSLTAPDDYYEQKLAGKKIDFTVTMRRVQAVLKPAADDIFAASLGKFKDVSELKDSLREGLLNEKKAKERQRLRLAILDEIISASKVPAPEDMVKRELDDMVHRFGHDLQERGTDLSMYLARMKKTEEDLRKDWTVEAQRQVRIHLVLRATAQREKISVSPQELEVALNATVAQLIQEGRATEEQMDAQRLRSALYDRMLTDRTLEFLERTCRQA